MAKGVYKTVIWRCNQKYNPTTQRASGGSKCNTGHVKEEQVYRAFQGIVEQIIVQRPEVVAACEAVLRELMDTADLDKAENRLNGEKERIQARAESLNNEASHRLIADFGERQITIGIVRINGNRFPEQVSGTDGIIVFQLRIPLLQQLF
mgnify:CR=1 FL=1